MRDAKIPNRDRPRDRKALPSQSNVGFNNTFAELFSGTGQVPMRPELETVRGSLFGGSAELLYRLPDARQRNWFPKHLQRFEQRRSIFASADCDADGLEHLSGFDAEFLRGRA